MMSACIELRSFAHRVYIAGATALVILSAPGLTLAQSVPRELSVLAARAGVESAIVGWCRGDFRAGEPEAYAVALAAPKGGGRYAVLGSDAAVVELAPFTGKADLSCYTAEQAKELNATIIRSDTIEGSVTPRWPGTVVCGFIDNVTAVCWQYSASDSKFLEVGRWVT